MAAERETGPRDGAAARAGAETWPLPKKLVAASLPTLVLLAVVFAVSELALRARYEDVSKITGAAEWYTYARWDLAYHWDAYHPAYGWTNLPGYRSDEDAPFRVTINDQGLRATTEYAPRPPEGMRRIAMFGDSFVFSEEVDDDETLPQALARDLEGAEVLNFGVHGFGMGQMLLRLEAEVEAFHPDHVVVVLLLPWDLGRTLSTGLTHQKPAFRMADSELEIYNLPVPTASSQPWLLRHSYAAAWAFGRPRPIPERRVGESVEVGRAILERMQAHTDRIGARLTVVFIVNSEHRGGIRKRIEGLRRSLRVPAVTVLDLVDDVRYGFAKEGHAMLEPGGHFSPLGNEWVARRIAKHLVGIDPDLRLRGGD